MDARAYVLIEADAGQVAAVVTALREVPGIRTADAVTGPYDIIAMIETSDQRIIGRLVIDVIHHRDQAHDHLCGNCGWMPERTTRNYTRLFCHDSILPS